MKYSTIFLFFPHLTYAIGNIPIHPTYSKEKKESLAEKTQLKTCTANEQTFRLLELLRMMKSRFFLLEACAGSLPDKYPEQSVFLHKLQQLLWVDNRPNETCRTSLLQMLAWSHINKGVFFQYGPLIKTLHQEKLFTCPGLLLICSLTSKIQIPLLKSNFFPFLCLADYKVFEI